jgi:hypothetical protein
MIFPTWCDPLQTARQRLEAGLRWRTRLHSKPLGLTALNTTCAIASPGQRWERLVIDTGLDACLAAIPPSVPLKQDCSQPTPVKLASRFCRSRQNAVKKGVIGGRESSNSAFSQFSASPEGLLSV